MPNPKTDTGASFDWTSRNINQKHVNHLETVTQLTYVQRYKARSYALLQLEPGYQVLDVGCGLGEDVAKLGQIVAPNGRVTGIDSGEPMIRQARERHADTDLPIEFMVNDATQMTFDDNTFDVARTDRVMQHIPDVQAALAEIVRVLKPGGRLVMSETDWGSLTLDISNREIFRKIRDHHADHSVRNGWMGRNLHGFMNDHGLQDISVEADTGVFTDYTFMERWRVWHGAVQAAKEAGVITDTEARDHMQDVEQRAQAGKHLLALTIFIALGVKVN